MSDPVLVPVLGPIAYIYRLSQIRISQVCTHVCEGGPPVIPYSALVVDETAKFLAPVSPEFY